MAAPFPFGVLFVASRLIEATAMEGMDMKAQENNVFELYLSRVNKPDLLIPADHEASRSKHRNDERPPTEHGHVSPSMALVKAKPKFSLAEWLCDRALKSFAARIERYPVFISLAALGSGFLVDKADRYSRLTLPPHES